MKTQTSILFKGIIAAMLVVIFAACGKVAPQASEVASKIEKNETLDQQDYKTIIDYCGRYAESAQKYYDIVNAQPNDSTAEAIAATNDLAALYAANPYIDSFRNVMDNADLSQFDDANRKLITKYGDYQAFPLPGGEAARLESKQVVGMIEQTPNSDTTGVISQGDGEAVDINVAN